MSATLTNVLRQLQHQHPHHEPIWAACVILDGARLRGERLPRGLRTLIEAGRFTDAEAMLKREIEAQTPEMSGQITRAQSGEK